MPDKEPLKALVACVCDLADRVNMDMRKQENLAMQSRIIAAFLDSKPPFCLSTDKTLIKNGPLDRRVRQGTLKTRWFFLFNDSVVYAKVAPNVLGHASFEGKSFTLSHVLTNPSVQDFPGNPSAFQIISSQKSFAVVAKDPAEAQEWKDAFKQVDSGTCLFHLIHHSFITFFLSFT